MVWRGPGRGFVRICQTVFQIRCPLSIPQSWARSPPHRPRQPSPWPALAASPPAPPWPALAVVRFRLWPLGGCVMRSHGGGCNRCFLRTQGVNRPCPRAHTLPASPVHCRVPLGPLLLPLPPSGGQLSVLLPLCPEPPLSRLTVACGWEGATAVPSLSLPAPNAGPLSNLVPAGAAAWPAEACKNANESEITMFSTRATEPLRPGGGCSRAPRGEIDGGRAACVLSARHCGAPGSRKAAPSIIHRGIQTKCHPHSRPRGMFLCYLRRAGLCVVVVNPHLRTFPTGF